MIDHVGMRGAFVPQWADQRIEGPWTLTGCHHLVLQKGGRGVDYTVSISAKTYCGEGTVTLHCDRWPGVIETSERLIDEGFEPRFAKALGAAAGEYLVKVRALDADERRIRGLKSRPGAVFG